MLQFYSFKKTFSSIRQRIKLTLCPHCKRQGFLVLHGHLIGYGKTELIKRGRRIFCNNRKMSNGCGKTFSLLYSHCLRGLTIFAQCLLKYLCTIKQGKKPLTAAHTAGIYGSTSSVYRLHQKLVENQSRIRSYLCDIKAPPPVVESKDPLLATITHLTEVFERSSIAEFQLHFQKHFLR